jgi:tetratricopeptide (TPR) repeat protein
LNTRNPIKQFVTMLGEIGGYVTAIVAYTLAIFEHPPPPFLSYASTISVLTVLVSSIVLWVWRWPKIIRKKPTETPAILTLKTKFPEEPAAKNILLAQFKTTYSHLYNMPLVQRRLEFTSLCALSLIALGLTGFKAVAVDEEISGFHCFRHVENAPIIVIANFDATVLSYLGDGLYNFMVSQPGSGLEVCRYNNTFNLIDEAQEFGESKHAAMVIWGNQNEKQAEVYLTTIAIDWNTLDESREQQLSSNSKAEITLLGQQIIAKILFFQEEPVRAQESLGIAIKNAVDEGLREANPRLVADSYFLLGLLFDPDQNTQRPTAADVDQAIENYSKSIDADPDLDVAYINLASLLPGETALEEYDKLIRKNSERYLFDAYLLKSQILLGQGKCNETIDDLETALRISGVERYHSFLFLINNLGMAYLLCEHFDKAEAIYQKMMMDGLTVDEVAVIGVQLNLLAESYPANSGLGKEVSKLISCIGQVNTPGTGNYCQ